MKKVCALMLAFMMMLTMSMVTSAEISPTGNKVTEEETDKSPKTGDINLLAVGLAGAACAVTAAAAAKKSKAQA